MGNNWFKKLKPKFSVTVRILACHLSHRFYLDSSSIRPMQKRGQLGDRRLAILHVIADLEHRRGEFFVFFFGFSPSPNLAGKVFDVMTHWPVWILLVNSIVLVGWSTNIEKEIGFFCLDWWLDVDMSSVFPWIVSVWWSSAVVLILYFSLQISRFDRNNNTIVVCGDDAVCLLRRTVSIRGRTSVPGVSGYQRFLSQRSFFNENNGKRIQIRRCSGGWRGVHVDRIPYSELRGGKSVAR